MESKHQRDHEFLPLKSVLVDEDIDDERMAAKGGEERESIGLTVFQSNEVDEMAVDTPNISILGYGNYGRAFASRLDSVGISYCVGSKSLHRYGNQEKGACNMMTYSNAAAKADIVFLAIPARAYNETMPDLKACLTGKIVIDISNAESESEECHALRLAKLLPFSHVVKAFNTVSAWSMENDVYGASRNVFVCGDHRKSNRIVMQLAQDLGFMVVDRGRLKAATVLEKVPLQLFPAWKTATYITLFLLTVELLYYYIREFISEEPGKVARGIALYHGNRILCWMALWLLSLVYLPGCIAGFLQLYRGTKYSRFPSWLDKWMKSRKQLGLYALAFAGMHACMSCIALAGEYVKYMSNVVMIPGTNQFVYFQFHWNAEISLLFAVIAMTLLVVLGITSLPGVNQVMSWKEWDFVQSKLGYLTLLFAFSHVTIYAYQVYDPVNIQFWKYGIPPAVYFQPLLPGLVLLMKMVLTFPCIASKLHQIRQGWEKKSQTDASLVV